MKECSFPWKHGEELAKQECIDAGECLECHYWIITEVSEPW